jgi:hypothetical protein
VSGGGGASDAVAEAAFQETCALVHYALV